MRWSEQQGDMTADVVIQGDKLYRRLSSDMRDKVLKFNAELRKNPDALRDLSFMGWELSLPEADYYMWRELIPALKSKDAKEKTAAWRKFLASDMADPYRVKQKQSGIII